MTPSFKSRMVCSLWIILAFIAFFSESGYAAEEVAKFPSGPITFIIPVPPGGATDAACRLVAKEAEKFLGRPIVCLNKPGGSFAVAIAAIASSPPDGYTIGYAGHPGLFVTPLTQKVPYHPVKDLKQIMQFGYLNIAVTVKGDSHFKKFEDIVAYARQNPKKLTYGSAGVGSFGHLGMEEIARRENVQLTHIPFKGSAETQVALLGGHILVGTGDFNYSMLEDGQIRLVLLIADARSPEFPQTPILKDLGYDIPAPTFLNVAGPAGLPEGIVKKLEEAFAMAMKQPAFLKGMKDLRLTVAYRNNRQMDEYVAQNCDAFAKLLKEIGLIK
jgi:tripartite-type tricarboxylate transporter receptor subunit TctC